MAASSSQQGCLISKYIYFVSNSRVSLLLAQRVHVSNSSCFFCTGTRNGLSAAGHNVRVRRLYYDAEVPEENYAGGTFPPILQKHELKIYDENLQKRRLVDSGVPVEVKDEAENRLPLAREIVEAIQDLQWCDSIIFVYPTWWSSYPAILKGYSAGLCLKYILFYFTNVLFFCFIRDKLL
jgi:putative NADPH-quinone reductase